jgi:mRNA (guanine-N(7))-methyltransferase domain/mRNA capping enzyme, catalytic domain
MSEKLGIYDKVGKDNVDDIRKLYNTIKKTDEFEFIFFSKKDKSLTLEKYVTLLRFLNQRSKKDKNMRLESNITTLDVVYNPDREVSYRAVLSNKEAIEKYMKKLAPANNHVIFRNLVKLSKKDNDIQTQKKEKNTDRTIDVDDLYMRARMSDELDLSSEEVVSLSALDETHRNKIILRYKERTSFYVVDADNEYVKIDLTVTRMDSKYNNLRSAIPRYELEIETKSNKANEKLLDKMFSEMEVLFKVLQQSNFIITRTLSNKVIENYRNLLIVPQASENQLYGRQPISLEIQYMELLVNKYAITDKADGERHFLIITDNHVYLLNKNLDVRDTGITLKKDQEKYNNSVVDGELIFLKNRHVFLVFDCLFEGGVDIRKETKLEIRLEHADNIINSCFVFGKQKNNKYDPLPLSNNFSLKDQHDYHSKQIRKMFDNLNHDIELEKQFILIRRKYFIHSLGARAWEIFSYSSLIWKLYTNDPTIKCPYVLDGLIYQPNEQAYIASKKESKFDDYKWKPPEKNSIDFYIEFVKDKDGNILSVYDNSYDDIADDPNATNTGAERIRNQPYKICGLHVGKSVGKTQVPVLFKEEEGLYDAYILLKDGEARDIEGNILSDKTVVEFYYNMDSNMTSKFKWIPLKTRHDKTESVMRYKQNYGNFETVANRVWQSITNPILISDFDDLAKGNNPDKNQYFYDKKMESIRKKIGHELIISAAKENKYHQLTTSLALPMRSFHNFLKSNIIYTFCHAMYRDNKQKTVLDFGCGRGGDNDKMYYAKVDFYVGIDYSKDSLFNPLDSAMSRYERQRKKPGYTKMTFIHGDFASELDYNNQFKSLGGMDYKNKQLIEKFFSTDPKKRTMFDVINSQFAIHYAFKNDETFSNLKNNINNYLRDDGFVLITTFDGNSIRKLLKGKDRYTQEYTDENGKVKVLFDIVKKYADKDDDVVMGTGNSIDVHMAWLFNEGVYETEYLIDDRFMIEQFKNDCNLELVTTDLFENQLTLHQEYLTKYAQYEADERTRKNLEKFSEIYKRNSVNDGCRVYTNMERLYVFRKNSSNVRTKNKKGGFMDTEKFVIEPITEYNNDYSFLGSVHHILKNHNIIPQTISPQQFYKDMGIGLVDDVEVDTKYKKIAKNLVIYQQEDNNEPEKVVDGVNIFVAERDCNDEYDVRFIKKSKQVKDDDVAVILIKDGTLYAPLYTIGEDGTKDGIFYMNDGLIKEMIEQE